MKLQFKEQDFQALWEKISVKSIYEVQFDGEKLIDDSKNQINAQLSIGERAYEVRTGELQD